MKTRTPWALLGAATLLMTPAIASADLTLHENTVIPVVFEDEISVRGNRTGDRFTVRVDDDRELPRGTRFTGRVAGIYPKRGDRPAYFDLEITDILLPDGSRSRVRAFPIPLSDRYTTRRRDGRFEAKNDVRRKENTVLGGAAGGLVLGSIFKKPVEGAIIGALAGVLIAESDRTNNGNVVVTKGQRMGVLIENTVTVRTSSNYDRWTRRDDPRDGDRYDRNDPRYDDRYDRRDDRWEPRNDRRDDRYDDWNRYGDRVEVRYRNRTLTFGRNQEPYREGNAWMVPLEQTARQLDLRIDKTGRSFYIEDEDSFLRVEQDSREYRLNGRRGTLARAVTERNGVVFVPLDLLAALKGEAVYVDGTRVSARY